jgi:uncharacterized protein YciI
VSSPLPRFVAVHNRPGPAWVEGRGIREQPHWHGHAAFIDGLVESGHLYLGGPYEETLGSLLVFQAADVHEVQALLAADPFVASGVFAEPDVRRWTIWADGRAR